MAVANFPSITPSARSWTPGRLPVQTLTSLAGYETRIQTGSIAVNQQLKLQFNNLSEAAGKSITDHFALAKGVYEQFDLPAAVFGGMSSYGHIKPSGNLWRYESAPSVEYGPNGRQSIEVSLVAVPQ